jgi:hypothetical protein
VSERERASAMTLNYVWETQEPRVVEVERMIWRMRREEVMERIKGQLIKEAVSKERNLDFG